MQGLEILFNRLSERGRTLKKHCRSAFESAQTRINDTKSYCSIQWDNKGKILHKILANRIIYTNVTLLSNGNLNGFKFCYDDDLSFGYECLYFFLPASIYYILYVNIGYVFNLIEYNDWTFTFVNMSELDEKSRKIVINF